MLEPAGRSRRSRSSTRRVVLWASLLYLHTFCFISLPFVSAAEPQTAIPVEREFPKAREADAFELAKDYGRAAVLWNASAIEEGSSKAHFRLGVNYAFGLFGFPKDEAKAVLHYYFSALGGDPRGLLALGYRHSRVGASVPVSCETSVLYYERAAELLTRDLDLEPTSFMQRVEAPDDPPALQTAKAYADDDVTEYYRSLARRQDSGAALMLGRFYFLGIKGLDRDFDLALKYLRQAASGGDGAASVLIGHIQVRKQQYAEAWDSYMKALGQGFPAANLGLGWMYLHGLGPVKKSLDQALVHFQKAAEVQIPEALYNLGVLALNSPGRRDFQKAARLLLSAAQKGSALATHKLALMHLHGVGVPKSCRTAQQYLKMVTQKVFPEAHEDASRAHKLLTEDGDRNASLALYLGLAEMGYETGETNAARVMDDLARSSAAAAVPETAATWASAFFSTAHAIFDVLGWGYPPIVGTPEAFTFYERAANQGNPRARVVVGDYYAFGWAPAASEPDPAEAVQHYRVAAEGKDPQAMFNMGYAHHTGIGAAKDYQLAKRYYDMCLREAEFASLAINLAATASWFEALKAGLWDGDRAALAGESLLLYVYDVVYGHTPSAASLASSEAAESSKVVTIEPAVATHRKETPTGTASPTVRWSHWVGRGVGRVVGIMTEGDVPVLLTLVALLFAINGARARRLRD